jgi:hypothetical protein
MNCTAADSLTLIAHTWRLAKRVDRKLAEAEQVELAPTGTAKAHVQATVLYPFLILW